jgi:hypothetical protein
MIAERRFVSGLNYQFNMLCVNLESGVKYEASGFRTSSMEHRDERWAAQRKLVQNVYRQISYDAKGDMLATALRKVRLLPTEEMKKSAAPDAKLALAPPSVSQPAATEKKPFLTAEKPSKPIPSVSGEHGEVKVSLLQPPARPKLEPTLVPQSLPVSKLPVTIERPVLTKEPLKPKTPVEIPTPQASVLTEPPERTVKQVVSEINKDTETPKVIAKISPALPSDLPTADKRRDFEKKLEKDLQDEKIVTDRNRLVVYDFDAVERLNVVSLILTEALREELFILGHFTLVNRENMIQILEELKLQQSGMVDEKQIVALGKLFAANEAVTGKLAVLGNTYVLQAKRTDIKTLGTLGLGSLKCAAGHEEELLSGMQGLARRLVGLSTIPHGKN